MISRRQALSGLAAGALAGLLPQRAGPAAAPVDPRAPVTPLNLVAAPGTRSLLGPDKQAQGLFLYNNTVFPVVRARRGTRLKVAFENRLPEPTTVHWHGIRLDNADDGVPALTQKLVAAGGGTFTYDVPLLDAGTFFFHPHCDETGQVGRGLAGLLIVDEDERPQFHAECIATLKDWRLAPDGAFLPFSVESGASQAGTFGTVRGVNGVGTAQFTAPAFGDVRVRLLNLDSTRTVEAGFDGGDSAVIAFDGHGVAPFSPETILMGAAQRLDFHLRMPAEGQVVTLYDYRVSGDPYPLARFTAGPSRLRKRAFRPIALPLPRVPRADLATAERITLTLQQATDDAAAVTQGLAPGDPLAKALLDGYCTGPRTFWAINQQSWPTGGPKPVPVPLARLQAGRSYVLTLTNPTQHLHPIHLHGHVFEVLSSNRSKLPRRFADTVLLQVRESVEIAFVAAPGNWVLHCHILDHMEAGMMGYLAVA